ncbi:MAG TPA: metal-dependent hydrolase [Alphaproteobacteria bacterium]|nr:metal-dependent hydrolase [Alphaproteobacteria bacterium]
MDSLTQALFGAAVGQLGFRHRLGRKALAWGAAAATVPDLDAFAVLPLGPMAEFTLHRGVTHSVFFAPVVAPVAGWLTWRWHRRRPAERRGAGGAEGDLAPWIGVWFAALATHPVLDVFTSYGTQVLAPLSNLRLSLPALPIIDILYTLALIAAVAVGIVSSRPRTVRMAAALAIASCAAWTAYGLHLNGVAEARVKARFAALGRTVESIQVHPTLFQPWYRRAVVWTPDAVEVGFLTTWSDTPGEWRRVPRTSHPALDALAATEAGRTFAWFAGGALAGEVVEAPDGTVARLHDLRYAMSFMPPDQGLWGIEARFDRDGRLIGEVVRFDADIDPPPGFLRRYWQAIWGTV